MKKIFLVIFLTVSMSNLMAQEYSKKELKNIKTYLQEIQTASLAKDPIQLTKLIYPIQTKDGKDYRKRIVARILENNTINGGDFAYSDKAFKMIVDSLYQKFKPIPKELYLRLSRKTEFNILKKLKTEDILIFDYKSVHIILIRYKGKLQLLFWEHMNKLLKPIKT